MATVGKRNSGPAPGAGRRAAAKAAGKTAAFFRRAGWRRSTAAIFLLAAFGGGFYLAQVYSDISELIEQRRAALTSAIYSAPLTINPGDQVAQLHLLERLAALSYTRVENPEHPGQYAMEPGSMTLYVREFSVGERGYPAALVRLRFSGDRVAGIADAYGVPLERVAVEPEIIGRLLPDAPAERTEVSLNQLPPYLVKGLLATEDRFFYYHFGFDPVRIIEAALVDFHSHRLSQGASTITQQLARTFIEKHTRTFSRKGRELAIAIVLELRLSKNAILERYINDVPMGAYDGTPIFGMPLAARYFFNKDLSEVTPAEAATLIGMIQAPTLFDPRRHPDASKIRRDTVLGLMRRAHVIDEPTYTQASAEQVITVKPQGIRRAPYFTDFVTAQVSKMPGIEGKLAGLRVYTTLDPELEGVAQDAVDENLATLERKHPRLKRAKPEQRLESSLVALDPHSGAVVAMVGGRDYGISQFNRAASAERQPGSAFKPIVYLTALDPALSPLSEPVTLASILPDRPMSFGGWTPANYERTYQGSVTVETALAESLNVPTAYLGSLLTPPTVIRTAHEMGVREDLPAYLPITIGAADMTLLELAGAYSVFAAGGWLRPPYAIEAVVDGQNHLLFQHQRVQKLLMSHAIAYLMTGALEGVLKYGTAESAARMGLNFVAAGKTGTTDDYRDAYFIGYTRQIVTGVWVGYDEPQSIGETGAQAALPAWVHFMSESVRQPQLGFGDPPPGITMVTVDPTTGGIATPACPKVLSLPFLTGTEPTRICPLHGGTFASASSGVTAAANAAANALGLGHGSSPSGAYAPPGSSPTGGGGATNNVLGAIGHFFGSLFGGGNHPSNNPGGGTTGGPAGGSSTD